MLGFCSHLKQERRYNAHAALLYNGPCTLTLTITDSDKKKHPYLRNVYTCKVIEIATEPSAVCARKGELEREKIYRPQGYYFIIYSCKSQELKIGQTIKLFHVSLGKRPQGEIALYFKKENVIGNYMCTSFSYGLCNEQSSIAHYFHQKRKKLWQRSKEVLSYTTYQLYSLVFLGKKVPANKKLNDIKQHCKSWGISHHLARSGLHLVAFVLIWEKILYYMPLAWWVKQLIIILLTFLYFLLSWSSISFIRSCLVFAAYKSSSLLSQQSLSIHIMGCITFIVLFINPYNLFFLDFQLSFGITFLLSWITHVQTVKNRRWSTKIL